jgi:hypothetical protein
LLVFLLLLFVSAPAGAQTLFILTEDGKLATALAANPAGMTTPVAITGVNAGDTLVGIDVRPQNQELYVLGFNSGAGTVQLYHISVPTAVATAIGTTGGFANGVGTPVPITGTRFDMDFNPVTDRLRVVTDAGLNFRMNPNTGAFVDGDLGGAAGSVTGINMDGPANGGTTTVSGIAYTNNRPNTTVTTLYTVDGVTNSLYIQNPQNFGTQTLPLTVTSGGGPLDFFNASLDIIPGVNVATSNAPVVSGSALMVARVGVNTSAYSINLVTGDATLLGNFSVAVRSSAIRTETGAAAVLSGSSLVRFDPTTPGTTTTVALTGVVAGETMVGIDQRPATGQLFGLGVNASSDTGSLYLIDPQTGACTIVGTAGQIGFVDAGGAAVDLPNPAIFGYGFDFNPAVDRIRVITASGLNFRLNPITGAPVDGDLGAGAGSIAGINPDGPQNGQLGGSIGASGAAYTNSFAGTTTTTLYVLDAASSRLYIQNPPNAGTETLPVTVTLGGSQLNFGGMGGFDIPSSVKVGISNTPATGHGWMVAAVGGVTGMYRIDLSTGAAALFGVLPVATTTGLVLWGVPPEIAVESPIGTEIADNSATIQFGGSAVATPVSRTILVKNFGTQPLVYSTTLSIGTAFSVTQNATGSIPGSGSVSIEVTFTPGSPGFQNDALHILSSDSDEGSFDIGLSGIGERSLTGDLVVATAGETRLSPLANDDLGGTFTITEVSDAAITIQGRYLIIPAGYTGAFTYTVSNGMEVGTASVTVVGGTPIMNPSNFNGLLFDDTNDIVGWAKVSISAKGVATAQVRGGTQLVSAKATFPSGSDTAVTFTKLGQLTLKLKTNGTVDLTLGALGGSAQGTLRAARSSASVEKHHVALASIDSTIPGGGFAIAKVTAKAGVTITGTLPDGIPFSAATVQGDNGSIAFFAVATKGAKPPALVGGELITANLMTTDVTGELVWSKLPQASSKGLHLGGVDTVLTANGCVFDGTISLNSMETLTLTGGDLAAPEATTVAVSVAGIPAVPTGSLKAWTGVSAKVGKFTAKVGVPGIAKPVTGSGLYLPKSQMAWGFFPGKTVGGRIQLKP